MVDNHEEAWMVKIGDSINHAEFGEREDRGDEEDPGGVAAGEGEMVDGNDGVVVAVVGVGRTGSAHDEFEESDEDEVKEGAESEGEEEVAAERGGVRTGKEECDGDGEEEAEVGEELEEAEKWAWGEGFCEVVDVERDGGVEAE
ncbi:uncharacterized protein DS421_1g14780 [Arachis hypogaea]|nr:uncharacterized protein DS421_1g14780 [Arachis hypogaea]